MSPISLDPDWVLVLETTTSMLTGMVDGGCELLPGSEFQFTPQTKPGALSM